MDDGRQDKDIVWFLFVMIMKEEISNSIYIKKKNWNTSHFKHQNHPWAKIYENAYSMINECPFPLVFFHFCFLMIWNIIFLFYSLKVQICILIIIQAAFLNLLLFVMYIWINKIYLLQLSQLETTGEFLFILPTSWVNLPTIDTGLTNFELINFSLKMGDHIMLKNIIVDSYSRANNMGKRKFFQ